MKATGKLMFLVVQIIITYHVYAADQDVRRHGAMGDGVTLDTAAFQAAINQAHATGGGVVDVSPGRYLVAHVELKSNVTLYLDKGARLLGSTNRSHYSGKAHDAILVANNAEHIGVEGEGDVDGQTTADLTSVEGKKLTWRGMLVSFSKCHGVTLTGVHFMNSDAWGVTFNNCENVRVEGVTVHNNYKRNESDGIDITSCKHVKISHCNISAGDDAICPKTFPPFPCEDIEVNDCVLESAAAALKLGTSTATDFRHIHIHDCKIIHSPVGFGIFMKDGGVVQDVVVENLEIGPCHQNRPGYFPAPLFMDIEKRNAGSKIGVIRDITLQNIHVTGATGLLLQGMSESPLENVTLRNITFDVREPEDYAKRRKNVGAYPDPTRLTDRDTKYARIPTYAALANMKNLNIDNFHVNIQESDFNKFPRSALALLGVDGAQISKVSRTPDAGRGAN